MSGARVPRPSRRGFLAAVSAWLAGGWLAARAAPAPDPAVQGTDTPYIGELRMFAGTFAPAGWAFCHGQLLSILENETLFFLIGTSYGGDGVNTFALPDLRGRAPLHNGNGFAHAQSGGNEAIALTIPEIPVHTHALMASTAPGTSADPTGGVPARNAAGDPQYAATSNTSLAPAAILTTGASAPHTNMQPWIGIQYIIALEGVYPSPA